MRLPSAGLLAVLLAVPLSAAVMVGASSATPVPATRTAPEAPNHTAPSAKHGHPPSPGVSLPARIKGLAAAAGAVVVHNIESGPLLSPGATGPAVLAVQKRLSALGYWLGTPDGDFNDGTEQAVFALQKAAGITRDGVVGPQTRFALFEGIVPKPLPSQGYVIQVDLADDLVMFTTGGKLDYVLNTSTGGGYEYTESGVTSLAVTPVGHFDIYSETDGLVVDPLGQLWRPKFFDAGFALHGDSYVPPEPVSHGCVRLSIEAIDWIWADNLAPLGTAVWVY
jgi:hypothetical protein